MVLTRSQIKPRDQGESAQIGPREPQDEIRSGAEPSVSVHAVREKLKKIRKAKSYLKLCARAGRAPRPGPKSATENIKKELSQKIVQGALATVEDSVQRLTEACGSVDRPAIPDEVQEEVENLIRDLRDTTRTIAEEFQIQPIMDLF